MYCLVEVNTRCACTREQERTRMPNTTKKRKKRREEKTKPSIHHLNLMTIQLRISKNCHHFAYEQLHCGYGVMRSWGERCSVDLRCTSKYAYDRRECASSHVASDHSGHYSICATDSFFTTVPVFRLESAS